MLRDWKTSSYWFTIKKTNQNNPAVVHGIGILKDSILGVWWLPCCPAWKHHHFCFLSAGRKPQFFKLKNKKGQKRRKWRKKKKSSLSVSIVYEPYTLPSWPSPFSTFKLVLSSSASITEVFAFLQWKWEKWTRDFKVGYWEDAVLIFQRKYGNIPAKLWFSQRASNLFKPRFFIRKTTPSGSASSKTAWTRSAISFWALDDLETICYQNLICKTQSLQICLDVIEDE